MSPTLVMTVIGLLISVMALGQIVPSISQAIFTQTANVGISKEETLSKQIQQYRTLEGSYPATTTDMIAKGYWRTTDNDNGFGGAYSYTINPVKGVVTVSTTISDSGQRAMYLRRYEHIFKPVDAGSGVVSTTFILPSTDALGAPLQSTAIPTSSTAPNPAKNHYWYDTTSGTAVLKVSDGSLWSQVINAPSSIAPPTM